MTSPALNHEQRQAQHLTPRLQQAVRLLQLSALDYEHELREMMQRNPFLEVDDAVAAPAADALFDSPAAAAVAAAGKDAAGGDADAASDGSGSAGEGECDPDGAWGRDGWLLAPGLLRDGAREAHASPTDMMVAEADLRQQLHGQANLLPLSERDHALVCSVIESLDDDGYLRLDLAGLGALADLDPRPDASEWGTAVRLVQSFEPAGVGARDVAECLLLQIDKLDPAWRALARAIVRDHLDLLARHDSAALAERLGCSVDDAESACQALRRLDPHPGWRFGHVASDYVVPDVIVRKLRGQWTAQLNPAARPRLRLNRSCADLFQRHRQGGGHAELGAHLQEARWTLRNIEQRFSTIQDVARAILRRQHLFFDYGPLAMKPLALRDIAREIGVHESTVCRVTNNKFMATPSGLFELKHFFSRAMPMRNGGASTGTAIRSVVRELIESEEPDRPLSDVAIAQRLAREGLTVARRTVTKYRQALKIAPAERRRAAPPAGSRS